MKIIPAIDIFNGRCVRLLKGDYAKVSEYNQCPIDQVKIFKNAGFDYIHIIDLNAAKSGGNENLEIIKEICKLDNINIQVGGGIRSINKINNLFTFGVDKVIVGTAAIIDEKFKETIISKIPSARLGEPDDIANAVGFLCSDQSSYINGETLHVNGGMYMA